MNAKKDSERTVRRPKNGVSGMIEIWKRRHGLSPSLWSCALLLLLFRPPFQTEGREQSLLIEIVPRFQNEPLVFDRVHYQTSSGQFVSVTRLDFLISTIALRRADGTWLTATNWQAYISAREGRTSFQVPDLPLGRYDRLRFRVGLLPEINHQDPANYPADHPLNPNLNGLHWGWMGGYVFLAIEGRWSGRMLGDKESDGRGYSFHLATDRQLMTVELDVDLEAPNDRRLDLVLNVDRIFDQPNRIVLSEAALSTHSRGEDALASQLRINIEGAFSVARTHSSGPVENVVSSKMIEMAPNATPYKLTISRFFPRPDLPTDNPLTEEGVALGRRLFFDPLLSANNSQACASCHQADAAFVDAGKAVSVGVEGKPGARNAMPLLNLAWKSSYFWDGRTKTLREQVLQPIENPIEMHETMTNVVAKLGRARSRGREEVHAFPIDSRRTGFEVDKSLLASAAPKSNSDYAVFFRQAFGTPEISADRVARALEQFLLTLVSYDSKFDRVLDGRAEFTEQEQRGFELFHTEYDPRRGQFGADCFHCHGGPLFQSQSFGNNGLDSGFRDLGRFLITKKEGDKGRFAVPSLRNVAATGPYMHDGRFKTLDDVIEHYASGVKRSPTLDPNLAKHPDGGVPLSDSDKKALIAFLKCLTDESLPPSLKRPRSE